MASTVLNHLLKINFLVLLLLIDNSMPAVKNSWTDKEAYFKNDDDKEKWYLDVAGDNFLKTAKDPDMPNGQTTSLNASTGFLIIASKYCATLTGSDDYVRIDTIIDPNKCLIFDVRFGEMRMLNADTNQNLVCVLKNPSSQNYKLVTKSTCDSTFKVVGGFDEPEPTTILPISTAQQQTLSIATIEQQRTISSSTPSSLTIETIVTPLSVSTDKHQSQTTSTKLPNIISTTDSPLETFTFGNIETTKHHESKATLTNIISKPITTKTTDHSQSIANNNQATDQIPTITVNNNQATVNKQKIDIDPPTDPPMDIMAVSRWNTKGFYIDSCVTKTFTDLPLDGCFEYCFNSYCRSFIFSTNNMCIINSCRPLEYGTRVFSTMNDELFTYFY